MAATQSTEIGIDGAEQHRMNPWNPCLDAIPSSQPQQQH